MDDLQTNNSTDETIKSDVKKMKPLQRIAAVIVSPAAAMKDIEVSPKVLLPILAMIIAPVLLMLVNLEAYKETLREYMSNMAEQIGTSMTPEQIDMQVNIGSITGLVSTPVTQVLLWILGTAILFGLMKAFKGQGGFKQYLSVTGYAFVITILSYAVITISSFLTGQFSLEVPVTSIASLLPVDLKGNFLYGMAKGFELFSIWQYVVIAIGAITVSKLESKKVYAVVSIIFIATLLYGGSMEILGGMFTK